MDREEAIKRLKELRSGNWWVFEDPNEIDITNEALDMAIEALSAQTDGDLISRKEALKAIEAETTEAWTESDADFNRGMDMAKSIVESLQSAEPKTDEEDELKFYYVESIDDYWIGARNDNFYYADWHKGLGFVWSHSKYLPWGEHIVDENTLWKEHTYPSEPIEIQFTDWIDGFVKKYFAETKTGEWIMQNEELKISDYRCSVCGRYQDDKTNYCPDCGTKMGGK